MEHFFRKIRASPSHALELPLKRAPSKFANLEHFKEWNEKVKTPPEKGQANNLDADASSFWSKARSCEVLAQEVEKARDPLRRLKPNLFTQSLPSKRGKVLSIPGLVRFIATGGANQNIWEARIAGGKTIRSVSVILDPGLFICEEPVPEFFPTALALIQAFTLQGFSVTVVHPDFGVVKDLSPFVGEGAWLPHSKQKLRDLCLRNRDRPYELKGIILKAASLLLADSHARTDFEKVLSLII